MKLNAFILLGLLALLINSCIPSLYPLYKEIDLEFDERLVGKWLKDEYDKGADIWTIKWIDTSNIGDGFLGLNNEWANYSTGKTYGMTAFQFKNNREAKFALHLLKLKGNYYLDFYPIDFDIPHGFVHLHMVPAHLFAKVEIKEDMFIMQYFDPEFLEESIENNRIKVTHVKVENNYLITAETDELQEFVKKYGDRPDVYMHPDTLRRIE